MESICSELVISEGAYKLEQLRNLLIKFGAVITEECIKVFEIESYIERIRREIKKKRAGQIIARNIKIALDDEFYLTDLRKRIEKRKFEDLMEEKLKEKENE